MGGRGAKTRRVEGIGKLGKSGDQHGLEPHGEKSLRPRRRRQARRPCNVSRQRTSVRSSLQTPPPATDARTVPTTVEELDDAQGKFQGRNNSATCPVQRCVPLC